MHNAKIGGENVFQLVRNTCFCERNKNFVECSIFYNFSQLQAKHKNTSFQNRRWGFFFAFLCFLCKTDIFLEEKIYSETFPKYFLFNSCLGKESTISNPLQQTSEVKPSKQPCLLSEMYEPKKRKHNVSILQVFVLPQPGIL